MYDKKINGSREARWPKKGSGRGLGFGGVDVKGKEVRWGHLQGREPEYILQGKGEPGEMEKWWHVGEECPVNY